MSTNKVLSNLLQCLKLQDKCDNNCFDCGLYNPQEDIVNSLEQVLTNNEEDDRK